MDILQFARVTNTDGYKGTGYASFLELEIIEWKFYTHLQSISTYFSLKCSELRSELRKFVAKFKSS
jgi:hypothetical protein